MAKKKACKKCKLFVSGEKCPTCDTGNFSTNWQGRLYIKDVAKSLIAAEVVIKAKGEYAIKVK